jgi:hypothetical protein
LVPTFASPATPSVAGQNFCSPWASDRTTPYISSRYVFSAGWCSTRLPDGAFPLRNLRTSPSSGQATIGFRLALYTPCLPLKGSDIRIEKRERESPVDKRGLDGVGGNRLPAPNKVVQRWV